MLGKGRHTILLCVQMLPLNFSITVSIKIEKIIGPYGGTRSLNLSLCNSFRFGVVNISVWPFKMYTYGKGRNLYSLDYNIDFSNTVQWILMQFGLVIAPNSGCLNLVLQCYSSFGFGAQNVFVSIFDPPFKCTVDKKL